MVLNRKNLNTNINTKYKYLFNIDINTTILDVYNTINEERTKHY